MAVHLAPPAGFDQRVKRDVGHRSGGPVGVDDRLVHSAEHLLHGFEIHAFARHAGRFRILLVNLVVALGLALGVEDGLFAISVGLGQNARRAALGFRHDFVGVGLGLVDLTLLVLLRGGHVAVGR